jgi:hypothetical protein
MDLSLEEILIIEEWFALYDRTNKVPYSHTNLGIRLRKQQDILERKEIRMEKIVGMDELTKAQSEIEILKDKVKFLYSKLECLSN